MRADVCAHIATASHNWYRDNNPSAIKKLLVHPGSAANRQTPRTPASTAMGVKTSPDIETQVTSRTEGRMKTERSPDRDRIILLGSRMAVVCDYSPEPVGIFVCSRDDCLFKRSINFTAAFGVRLEEVTISRFSSFWP